MSDARSFTAPLAGRCTARHTSLSNLPQGSERLMSLMHASSPHAHGPTATSRVMAWVLAATLPGIAVLCWHYGWGVLFNLVFACLTGIALEALLLKLRGRPVSFFLKDNSALVTCVLLAVSAAAAGPLVAGTDRSGRGHRGRQAALRRPGPESVQSGDGRLCAAAESLSRSRCHAGRPPMASRSASPTASGSPSA